MHRQSSRTTTNMDTIECTVNPSDLVLENEANKREHDQRSKPRRDQPYKRSNEISVHRSNHRSPPSVARKRHPSPPPPIPSSSSSSRSHQYHHPSQRYHRGSSPSPSPPPPPPPPPSSSSSQSSSRHYRSTRPVVPTKRPHPQSESPYERRPPIHRSRPEIPTERTIGDVLTSIPLGEESKITPKHESGDLSLVSEDETTKTHDSRPNGTKTNESPLVTTNNKLHSTPSVPTLRPNSNESLLEMSTIPQECELSLFAKSALSTANTSLIFTPTINSNNDFTQTIDLISKYKTMEAIPTTSPQVVAWTKDILIIIQKHIELQKIEVAYRERELKLRTRELAEQEKRFNDKPSEAISTTTPINSEPVLITKPTVVTEEKTPSKSEVVIDQDIINVSPEESVVNSIPPPVDTSKMPVSNKTASTHSSVTRKSRFSQLTVDLSKFSSPQKPTLDLYSDDLDEPTEPMSPSIRTDLKITSSSTCRKVEIQSGNVDKSSSSKGSSHDLRLTLDKNRAKQSTNDEHESTNGNETVDDHESTMKSNDNKQQSHDYQQQRSFTSTSIEPNIDEKRDVRRHRQQYSSSSSSSSNNNNNFNERSYNHGKYRPQQKRYETDDSRPPVFDPKHSKSSRTTHKNNY